MTAPQYETYDDADRLRELYWDTGMTQKQIADLYGVARSTISKAMVRHGVETRGKKFGKDYYPFKTDPTGYERWNCGHDVVYVHQLLAIADGGNPHKVFSGGDYHIHHKNGCPWDNRHDNIELVTPQEHADRHPGRGGSEVYTDDELLEWIDSYVDVFGIAPSQSEMRDSPGPDPITFGKRFGTWRNAVRKVGYVPRGVKE